MPAPTVVDELEGVARILSEAAQWIPDIDEDHFVAPTRQVRRQFEYSSSLVLILIPRASTVRL